MPKSERDLAGRRATLLGLVGCAGLVACGAESGTYEVSQRRVVERVEEAPQWHATLAERFAMLGSPEPSSGMASGAGGLAWTTPEGWAELPPTSMRQANFRVGEVECYLTVLGGDGGGLAANVNRWRSQLGLGALGGEALDALPTATLAGAPATLVDFEGTYGGMSGADARAGYRLVGLLSFTGSGARFLKMTGPADQVAVALDGFHALARSFGSAASADPHAGHDHGPGEHHDEPVGFGDSPSVDPRSGLSWSAPDGWLRAADRSMRVVTFHTDASEAAECYVTVLGGDGGGLLDNVNRWRGQFGAPLLSATELDLLDRVPTLGTEGVLVDATGGFRGMRGETIEDAALLGLVVPLADRTVFVKAVGERAAVLAARDDFVTFCRSLEVSR